MGLVCRWGGYVVGWVCRGKGLSGLSLSLGGFVYDGFVVGCVRLGRVCLGWLCLGWVCR